MLLMTFSLVTFPNILCHLTYLFFIHNSIQYVLYLEKLVLVCVVFTHVEFTEDNIAATDEFRTTYHVMEC